MSVTNFDRQVATWLLICCALVFLMVILGGVTRLTGSGLSMAEWRPIMGAIPPLSAAEWQRVFEIYQQTPEFQKVNADMDVEGFKDLQDQQRSDALDCNHQHKQPEAQNLHRIQPG